MTQRRARSLRMVIATAAVVSSLVMAATASAAEIVVDSTADPAAGGDDCTLRQALESANTDATPVGSGCVQGDGTDTITFDLANPPNTIVAPGLGISSNVTIQGPGVDDLAVSGNDAGRVFHVTSGTATISDLVIEDGRVTMPSAGPDGGAGMAIDFGASVTLDDAAVVGNAAVSTFNGGTAPIAVADGAGILNSGGDLTVRDTHFLNNTLSATAINGDAFTIGVARGAAIATVNGTVVIDRSTFSGNTAQATATDDGTTSTETRGAITIFQNNFPEDPDASITSSTVVDNSLNNTVSAGGNVTQSGGGIYANEPTNLTSSTVTGNTAADGANVDADTLDGSITMRNSIVAEPAGGANCSDVSSAGYNLSSDQSCGPTETGDIEDGDPNLLALGEYGGPTPTRPPAPPSVGNQGVIDLGINSSPALSSDQRGFDRTWNFDLDNGTDGDGTDIGAVEIQGAQPLGTTPTSPGDSGSPVVFGSSEQNSNVSLFADSACTPAAVSTGAAGAFESPGLSGGGPYAENTSTSFTARATYGTAISACSDPITYQRRPALPTLTSTNPPSGADNNGPRLIGTATASSTVNVYTQASCTGPVAGTGTGTDLAGTGISVSVPDNSTTTFYAQATGVGGTTGCSTGLSYTETTPPPPAVIPAPTGQRAAALAKCKKKKKKLDWSKKRFNKCRKQANGLPV